MPSRMCAAAALVTFVMVGCVESTTPSDSGADAMATAPRYIGGPCTEPSDCGFDATVDPNAIPFCLAPPAGGYCALGGCLEPGFACPGLSQCVPRGIGGFGFCVNPCDDRVGCRPGFECFESVTGFHFCRVVESADRDAG